MISGMGKTDKKPRKNEKNLRNNDFGQNLFCYFIGIQRRIIVET